jgi:RNA polymerase sigma factor (sigma-70 family)
MPAALPVESLFTEHRRLLWSLAYRMTGSAADADDVVQDTFVRTLERPPRSTDEPLRPWLVKVALNLARDRLRARRRREYVGPWLPSPIDTGAAESAGGDARGHASADAGREPPSFEPVVDGVHSLEGRYDLLESVSFAFLLALEALTPTQRAVLLLRDVFDYSVRETADALDLTESNVKTTHHRARAAMSRYDRTRQVPTARVQQATRDALTAFLRCLERHDVAGVEALLAEDVRTTTDGGGEFRAALRTIVGRDKVSRFYLAVVENAVGATVRMPTLNGLPAVIADLPSATGRLAPRFALAAELNHEGKIAHLYVVSATAKLTGLRQDAATEHRSS